jgi:hypothetical protein
LKRIITSVYLALTDERIEKELKQLCFGFYIRFSVGVFSVQLYGFRADRKFSGNGFAAVAEQYSVDHLALSLCEQACSKAFEG